MYNLAHERFDVRSSFRALAFYGAGRGPSVAPKLGWDVLLDDGPLLQLLQPLLLEFHLLVLLKVLDILGMR
jgi:hypothetical protein